MPLVGCKGRWVKKPEQKLLRKRSTLDGKKKRKRKEKMVQITGKGFSTSKLKHLILS